MKSFLQKAKAEFRGATKQDSQSTSQHQQHQQQDCICDPTPLDIIRYRYHHGTNLGSIYVIERWLQGSRFPDGAESSSELAAVKAWVDRIGIEATKQKFEERWANAVSEEDIQWLVHNARCTTIRLPIGYFDLPGEDFTKGSPFEPYSEVYQEAWRSIKTLIQRLRSHSIGVLIDLHALPGGANAQDHSGTNSGQAELWTSPFNRALGVRCCQFLALESKSGADLAGLQLVNEAEWDAPGMYSWYDECIAAISSIDDTLPVIISDGWDLNQAISWSLQKNTVASTQKSPVVIDTHFYWAFTDGDKQKSPYQIIDECGTRISPLDGKEGSVVDRGGVQVIVGEYSCVLTEDSWAKSGDSSRSECVRKFGQAQSQRWQHRAGGSFFWTWKMDWMPGGEWGFKEQSDAGNIVPPKLTTLSQQSRAELLQKASKERNARLHEIFQQHVDYWSRVDPGGHYEHDKYEYGLETGYQDAFVFLEGRNSTGDRIGMLELWVLKRVRESGYRGGFTWLFEQGLRKGLQEFYSAVGL